MTIFWLNKCLDPFKLKNPLSLSLRTCVFLRHSSFSSQIDAQSLTSKAKTSVKLPQDSPQDSFFLKLTIAKLAQDSA